MLLATSGFPKFPEQELAVRGDTTPGIDEMTLRFYPVRTPGKFGHPKAKFLLGLLHAPCGPPFTVRRQVQEQASTMVLVNPSRDHEVLPYSSGFGNVR